MGEPKKKILIIDDDETLAFLTSEMLKDYGYETALAPEADAAFEILKNQNFHLVLLDINLPGISGFEICEELRRISKVPVIFASARTREDDKIKGLDIGGDDYLEKPYSLKELLARVNALIRRTYGEDSEREEYQFGDIYVDAGQRRVTRAGEELRLSLKEFDVLCCLCRHRGKAVHKERISFPKSGEHFQRQSFPPCRYISGGFGKSWKRTLRSRNISRQSGESGTCWYSRFLISGNVGIVLINTTSGGIRVKKI